MTYPAQQDNETTRLQRQGFLLRVVSGVLTIWERLGCRWLAFSNIAGAGPTPQHAPQPVGQPTLLTTHVGPSGDVLKREQDRHSSICRASVERRRLEMEYVGRCICMMVWRLYRCLMRVAWPRITYRLGRGRLLMTERALHGYEPETTSIIPRLYMCISC